MKNYLQLGDNITLPAPYNVISGEGALVGSIFGVASTTQLSTEDTAFVRIGVFTLPKVAGTAWTGGLKLYWDAAAKNVTTVSASNTLIGAAGAPAASADTSGVVLLTGQLT